MDNKELKGLLDHTNKRLNNVEKFIKDLRSLVNGDYWKINQRLKDLEVKDRKKWYQKLKLL